MVISGPNCSQLAVRTDFNKYAKTLLDQTNGNLQLLEQCQFEVCSALWGEINGDISGIGMIVGYVQAQALGLALGIATLAWASRLSSRRQRVSSSCLRVFEDSATLFAFSIELAAIVVLVREDFGITSSGMGDYTVRITQAVAMVVLLPMVYPMVTFWTVPFPSAGPKGRRGDPMTTAGSLRLGLFVICWFLAFYPFFSRMNVAFGPNKIKQHHRPGSSVLTTQQLAIISGMCFSESDPITILDDRLLTALVVLTYISLSVFVIGRVVWLGVKKKHPGSKVDRLMDRWAGKVPGGLIEVFPYLVFASLATLAAGLLWSIIHTQISQAGMTANIGATDSDNRWSFGQIIAVTVLRLFSWNSDTP